MKHAFHVLIAVGRKTMTFGFRKDSIQIGRLSDNDLVLPDPSVEEHHAWLERDLAHHSRFRLRPPFGSDQSLADGETVAIGRYALTVVAGDPPCEREKEFLDHLAAHPSDDTMRSVYADWLEENDRCEAAELIRVQLTLATLRPDTAAFEEASQYLRGLGGVFPFHWRRIIARPPIENCDVRFELQCPKQWGDLTPTTDPTQRFCGTCQQHVHYAPTVEKARRLAIAGQCVVVDVSQHRRTGDLDEDEDDREMLAGLIAPPSWG